MKSLITTTFLGLLLTTKCVAQSPPLVTLNLKNNSVFPRHFKFLERHPSVSYPNVFTAYIMPGQSYTVQLKPGTVLSQVTQREINATMRGQTAPGQLLLVVKANDQGRTVALIERKIRQ
ncbi:hypothetical protein [Fibrella aquatilis]|uniref:Uncharacterized protein n=1 Tax=Fibrella aquatilis TaxID=2817059 RepID=A0A939G8I8_9BACT|nr:hypothetical protein [Fibrella aquatilis]MBO0932594.1 hypothetical protein [Fibrella aquatilis]